MEELFCIISLLLLVGVLSATAMKYRNDYNKAMKLVDTMKKNKEITTKTNELLQLELNMMKQKYESMEKEHSVIFNNLEENPMYLVKAEMAYRDLCSKLSNESIEIANKIAKANLVYDSTSENYYDRDTEEITLSLFSDHNDEQICYMYDYLNDKYGLNLESYDIKTNIIFTALHELGHYVDYTNKKDTNEYDSYVELNLNQKKEIKDMEYGPKCWEAYREVPTESFADCFAINFMKKHYPELV